MKLAVLGILFSFAAQAGEICYDDTETLLTTEGKHCVNPWNAIEPDLGVAQANADSAANKLCFPFQAIRTGDYVGHADSGCRIASFGVKVSAEYQCAR